MTKEEEDFKLLKIQNCVLKVNVHCDGCKHKVKKILQRIEGVFQVNIDADQQKVTVSGSVDSTTLIKKLTRAGKHAELWSTKSNQNQKQKNNFVKEDKNNSQPQKQNLIKNLEAFKNQAKFPFNSEDDDDYTEDDEDELDEHEIRYLREKMGMLEQQANIANKNAAIAAASNGKMMNNNVGNLNGGKKGNPNQNVGIRVNNPGGTGIDPKTIAAMKMNNAGHLGGGNMNIGLADGKRASELGAMMNLAGFHGNNPNPAAALGQNPNGIGPFQVQSNGPSGFSNGGGQYPSTMLMNMNGYNHPSASQLMMNNNQQQHIMQQQPQMMYNRSPYIQPNTGYYYNSFYGPVPYSYYTENPNHHYSGDHQSVEASSHNMFSDENTSSSCSIM